MNNLIPIIDLDNLWPEEVTVRHTGTLPDFYLRNVIDLASIVGTYNLPIEIHEYDYESPDFGHDFIIA